MIISIKTNYLLLIFLVLLNIALRIPWTPHGPDVVDSTFIWSLSNSISTSGYIKWALHPLSFSGLYPLSYPSGSPVILSTTSQLTGLNTEHLILIYGFFLALLGLFGSYAMALKIGNARLFPFFVSFAFSTSPVFVELTRWTASTRNLFMALFPLFLWALFWDNKTDRSTRNKFILIVFLVLTLSVSHRLSYLIVLVLLSYILTLGIIHVKYNQFSHTIYQKLLMNTKFLLSIFIIIFSLQFSNIGFYDGIWGNYQTGAFAEGTSVPTLLLNLSSNYVGMIGVLIVFGLIGFVILLNKPEKEFNDIFIIYILVFCASISALGIYVAPFILPIVSILISLAICELLPIIRIICLSITNHYKPSIVANFAKNGPAIIILICLLVSISFSCYMVQRHLYVPVGETGNKQWMNDDVIAVGDFFKEHDVTIFLSNDRLIERRIYASAGIPFLGQSMYALINGWIETDDLNVTHLSIGLYNINRDSIYKLSEPPEINNELEWLYSRNVQNKRSQTILNKYNINYVVINNKIQNKATGESYRVSESTFIKSATNNGFKIYNNNKESIHLL